MADKTLTLGDVFVSMEAAKQAVEECIVSQGESYKVVKSDVKKKWITVCKDEDCAFPIRVSNVKGGG